MLLIITSILDRYTVSMTKNEIDAGGYSKWKWGYTAPRQLMVNKAVMGEYFHIYR